VLNEGSLCAARAKDLCMPLKFRPIGVFLFLFWLLGRQSLMCGVNIVRFVQVIRACNLTNLSSPINEMHVFVFQKKRLCDEVMVIYDQSN
jgi:hypothetical protein